MNNNISRSGGGIGGSGMAAVARLGKPDIWYARYQQHGGGQW